MATNTTTLYIDNYNMRLMITRGKRIIKLADMPLDINLGEIDEPGNEEKLVEKIKYLFQSNRISSRKIILGISGLQCLTRPIVLPELPRAMLEEAITREARRVLPVPVEQLYLSWQIMSVAEDKINAFMVGIPRHIADPIIKVVTQAGFKPYLMDIKPLALARLAREADAVIVDIQPNEFDIVVLLHGMPQPIRTVPFSTETTSLKERLIIVRDELQRTVQFFNSNNVENKIQPGAKLLVSGEITDEVELYNDLAQDLDFSVALLSSPLKCLKQLDPSHHLVNVGLTLKELAGEANPVSPNFNTLPVPYQPKQVSMNRLMALPAVGIAVALLIVLGMTVQDAAASLDSVKTEIDANKLLLDKRTALKKELTQDIAASESKLAGLEASRQGYTDALNSITLISTKMNADLDATLDNVVADLDLKQLAIKSGSITISGKAAGEQDVFQYVRKLASTGRFIEITITSIRSVHDEEEDDGARVEYALNLKIQADKK